MTLSLFDEPAPFDLAGLTVPCDGETWTVVGLMPGLPTYALIESPSGRRSCRSIGLLRQHALNPLTEGDVRV